MSFRVIPVLDLQAGRAVQARGGDRAHYQPLGTRLHANSEPLGVARGFREVLNLRELYLADLDAIAGKPPSTALYQAIGALGIELWVDAGIRDRGALPLLIAAGVSTLVVGLETVRGPAALAEICSAATSDRDRLVFSLDLRAGLPVIGPDQAQRVWGTSDLLTLADSVVALGIRRLLLLDLARVGTGRGVGTLPLLSRLRADHPGLELTVGGGIADRDEVKALAQAGADAVLIGSALHDGRIGAGDIAELTL
jgi:phosphoribosylformimino-5-aminoimidazole carboxamide ribotide isomerase